MNEFPSIQCPKCKKVSYNTNDIDHKFCGFCHEWHEFMNDDIQQEVKKTMDALNKIIKGQKQYCPYPACLVQYVEHYHIDRNTLTFLKPEELEKLEDDNKTGS